MISMYVIGLAKEGRGVRFKGEVGRLWSACPVWYKQKGRGERGGGGGGVGARKGEDIGVEGCLWSA